MIEANQPQLTEEDVANLPVVHQIMCRIHKSQHVQELLIMIRGELLLNRAYQKLNWGVDASLYEAAAASGYSLGELALLDSLIQYGTVLPE